MISISTDRGEFTGRSVDSIVRREFGRAAEVRRNVDPNSPTYGMVVKADRHQVAAWHVLGTIYGIREV